MGHYASEMGYGQTRLESVRAEAAQRRAKAQSELYFWDRVCKVLEAQTEDPEKPHRCVTGCLMPDGSGGYVLRPDHRLDEG